MRTAPWPSANGRRRPPGPTETSGVAVPATGSIRTLRVRSTVRPSTSWPVITSCVEAKGPVSETATGSTIKETTPAGETGSGSTDGSVGHGRGRDARATAAASTCAAGKLMPAAPVEPSKNRTIPSPPPTATAPLVGWNATAYAGVVGRSTREISFVAPSRNASNVFHSSSDR